MIVSRKALLALTVLFGYVPIRAAVLPDDGGCT